MNYFSVEVNNHIASITFDHAPVNALTLECYKELNQLFTMLGKMADVRVAILRSNGPFFCPGSDLQEFAAMSTKKESKEYSQIVNEGLISVYNCEIPLIAAVHGHAYGAGMSIAACADIIIAAEKAEFGIPEIKVGVIGAVGFMNLIVPEKVARYLALSGESISAQEVMRYGGIHKVVAKEDVYKTAKEVANKLLKNGPTALRLFKQAMNTNDEAKLLEKCAVEGALSIKHFGSDEAKEAINSILQGRPADYSATDN